jgi:hypothetical protein
MNDEKVSLKVVSFVINHFIVQSNELTSHSLLGTAECEYNSSCAEALMLKARGV